MLKEPTGNATCLRKTAHKRRDNLENARSEMWQVAQPATLRLRAAVNQVTLAATL
jgi:hypothetical protein